MLFLVNQFSMHSLSLGVLFWDCYVLLLIIDVITIYKYVYYNSNVYMYYKLGSSFRFCRGLFYIAILKTAKHQKVPECSKAVYG